MSITGVTSTTTSTTTSSATTASTTADTTVSKDDFLKLLVAQLENQDPLNPVDGTQFTAQLAQFSSLEQLQNIDSDINGLNSSQTLMSNAQAVSYIGKQIKAQDSELDLTSGQASDLTYHLDSDVQQVTAQITDAQGNFVASVDQSGLDAGDHTISWDGKNSQNVTMPDGAYTVTVKTVDAAGSTGTATTYSVQTVNSVTYASDGVHLNAGGHDFALSGVETIQDPATSASATN